MKNVFNLKNALIVLLFLSCFGIFQSKAYAADPTMCGLLPAATKWTGKNDDCLGGQSPYNAMDSLATSPTRNDEAKLKSEFLRKMKIYRESVQTPQRVGAVYIMAQITGDSTPSWDNFSDRINSSETRLSIGNFTFTKNTAYKPSCNCVVLYNQTPDTVAVLKIDYNGNRVLNLKLDCGNPVGGDYPPIPKWALNPKSSPAEQNAYPGDTKNFSHTVSYTGNYPTYKYRVLYSYVNASTGSGSGVWITAVNWKNGAGNSTENTSFKVPASYKKGDRYCQRIEVTLSTGPGSANKTSSPYSCLTILTNNPFKFTPTPSVLLDDDESPSSAVYTPTVKNESSTNASTTITTKLYIDGGSTLATKNETQSIAAGAIFSGNPTTYTQAISSLTTGTKVCSTVTVAPYTDTITTFTSTPPACATVVNKPYFKAINGSVSTGNCTSAGATLAGWFKNISGAPYKGASTTLASLSRGQIIGFGSAQLTPSILPTELAFSSIGSGTSKDSPSLGGNFGAAPCLNDATQAASPSSVTGTLTFDASTVSTNYFSNAALTIAGGTIPTGKKITVFVKGNAYISGDIKYSSPTIWSSSADMPSLILRVEGNIYIANSVSQLDGLYIAKPSSTTTGGAIYTCSTAINTPSNNFNTCKLQLIVNGIFIANKINLLRTFGSLRDVAPNCQQGNSENTCAGEVFKLSPEIYLNGTTMDSSISTGSYKYDAITSLPPIL